MILASGARCGFATRSARGFTLIELMIVVAIVAILLAIAYPSYREHIRKGNRADAKAVLVEQAQFMDRFFTTNGTFTGAGVLFATSPKGASGGNIRYDITMPALGATTFTVQAAPANMQAGDTCGTLSITNTGAQSPSTAGCW